MINRNTWILLVAFVVLLAGTVYWQRSKMSANATPTPFVSTTNYVFQDVISTEIQSVQLSGPDNQALALERDASGQWMIVQPKLEPADSVKVESTLSQLAALPLVSTPDLLIDLKALGLQPPLYSVLFKMSDGRQFSLNAGKATPTGSGYYILTSQRAVAVASKLGLDTVFDLLTTPPVQPTATPTEMPASVPESETSGTPAP